MNSDRVDSVASRLFGIVVVSVLIGTLVAPSLVLAGGHHKGHGMVLKFDVAENGSRFVPDDAPFVDGFPAYGNSFITQGFIYPFRFLDHNEGVLADGTPAFPNKVIGRWTCFGWHVADFATLKTGPSVVTTQIYEFSKKPGRRSIVTEGFELADIGVPIRRPITGGTGLYARARGQATQRLLRFPNASQGVDLRFRLRVQ